MFNKPRLKPRLTSERRRELIEVLFGGPPVSRMRRGEYGSDQSSAFTYLAYLTDDEIVKLADERKREYRKNMAGFGGDDG